MAYVPIMEWGSRPSVTYDQYGAIRASHMGKPRKKQPTLVVPSLRWECAGMYTVYVLCCYGAYLIAAI